jgi:chromosome segregation ATPase
MAEKDSQLLPELEKAQKAKSDLQAKLTLTEEDLTILKQNLEVLVQENDRKTEVCQKLKVEISEKEAHAQNLKKQKENVSELCQLAQRENIELADNLDARELHNENLKKEIDGLESALEFSKVTVADFQADVTNKAALLEVTERECQKLNQMIHVNFNQLSDLVKELSHKDTSYHEIMDVNTNLDSEIRELRMREETYSSRQMS